MDEKELEALKTSNPKAYESFMAMKAENEKLKAPPKKDDPPPKKDDDDKDDDDEDLNDKARKAKEAKSKQAEDTKKLEGALKFNLSAADFVKSNKDLLPTEVEDVLKQAEKESYDSAIEKASAIQAGMIKAFFSVQANVDFLTKAHRAQIEDYNKLTVGGRMEKAAFIFENIFEPALETMQRVKKAEELGKSSYGHGGGSKTENAYKEKLMNVSRKTHLGEKGEKNA